MPRYDYCCDGGHVVELLRGFDDEVVACECGLPARRQVPERAPLVGGGAIPPMAERRIPLSRFVEAQGEMVRAAERSGVPAPDVLGIARRQARAIAREAPELISGT